MWGLIRPATIMPSACAAFLSMRTGFPSGVVPICTVATTAADALDGKFNCDVECNPIQAGVVEEVIQKMEAGEEVPAETLVEDSAFVAPGIESDIAITMTDEILAGRAY